jgi:hypothetical protein
VSNDPITKEDLREAFSFLERASLKCSTLIMNERDYADMVGNPCPECGRMISSLTDLGQFGDCGTCSVRFVMEE